MSQSTLQPHICGNCKCPIAPFRWSDVGKGQCSCETPIAVFRASEDARRFLSRDEDPLLEARDRADVAGRLLFPHLYERTPAPELGPEPLNAESASRVCSWLMDARSAILTAALPVPLEGEELLHGELSALVGRLDDIVAGLAGREFE